MNINALILILITTVVLAGEFVANRFIKKVTNAYWFWLGISLFLFIWYIVFRFTNAWTKLADNWMPDTSTLSGSFIVSKGFLLDLCPFFALALPLALIVDPSRKVASLFSPFVFLAAFFIVYVQFWTSSGVLPTLTIKTFFTGIGATDDYKLYEFIHMNNLFLSLGVMLNTPKLQWKGYLGVYGVALGFLTYVGIIMLSTGCNFYVSGLSINDWIQHPGQYDPITGNEYVGQYYFITSMFGNNPTLAMSLFFPFCGLLVFAFLILMDFMKSQRWWQYGNAKTKCWWQHYNYKKFEIHKFI